MIIKLTCSIHSNFRASLTKLFLQKSSTCLATETAFNTTPDSIEKHYGDSIANFNEAELLKEYNTLPMKDWQGATWPPNIVHKDIWDLVGGYSIEFSPGMYSDPDFSFKLWKAGVRLFKGIAQSRVYHFGSLSVKRIKKNRGYHTFISKWGMTSGSFSKYYIHRGEQFIAPLSEPIIPTTVHLKNFAKRCWTAIWQ